MIAARPPRAPECFGMGSKMAVAERLFRYAGVAVFGSLFLLAARTMVLLVAGHPLGRAQALATVGAGLMTWLVGRSLAKAAVRSLRAAVRIAIVVLLLGAALRFFWAILVPTTPVSDFLHYHRDAVNLSRGETPEALHKNAGYRLLLSVVYRIDPDPLTGRLLNAAASTVTLGLILLLGFQTAGPPAGVLAGFLFAILPSEVNMVSVIGTEVVATTLFVAVLYLFVRGAVQTLRPGWIGLAGVLFGAALTVRSSLMFYALPLLLVPLWAPARERSPRIGSVIAFGLGVAGGVVGLALWCSLATGKPVGALVRTQDSYPFLSGTNVASRGMWNAEDSALYFSWPEGERDGLAQDEAFRRIEANPAGFLRLVARKIGVLMADNTYGSWWSIHYIDWEAWKWSAKVGEAMLTAVNSALAQETYVLILGLCASSFLGGRLPLWSGIALVVVVFTLLPHTILEVQPRYHHTIVPVVILAASQGWARRIPSSPEPRRAQGWGE